jgi:hypothetical protein
MSEIARDPHLSETMIRLYWRDQLSEHEERLVEEHYLECPSCQSRVYSAEAAATAPDAPATAVRNRWRVSQWVAAAIVALSIGGAAWYSRGLNRSPGQSENDATSAPASAGWHIARLAPPLRIGAAPDVHVGNGEIVVFVLDAREAGPGRERFDVELLGVDQRRLLTLSRVASTDLGELHVPVDEALLVEGMHSFEVAGHGTHVGFPFMVRRDQSPPNQPQ